MRRVLVKNLSGDEKKFQLERRRWIVGALVAGFLAVLVAGCGAGAGRSEEGKLRVAATTSVIGDMVRNVGGDRVEVTTIVPTGGTPETFQPSPSDAGKISDARVVFMNGLGLDGWVRDLIESAGGEDRRVVELSRGLEPIERGERGDEHAGGNPHFWLDVSYAERYVQKIRDGLIEADPRGTDEYRANAGEYLKELERLDRYIKKRAASIPEERRKLVTTHDAFPYFARAYGFKLVAVVLDNPEAEPGSRKVARVVRTIEKEDVPAIFTEPQFNPGLAETIAREAGVRVEELYTDTLVENGSGSTYVKMMRTNADRVVEALK